MVARETDITQWLNNKEEGKNPIPQILKNAKMGFFNATIKTTQTQSLPTLKIITL